MVPITFPEALLMALPPYYAGRWRAVFHGETKNPKGVFKECVRVYCDMYEN